MRLLVLVMVAGLAADARGDQWTGWGPAEFRLTSASELRAPGWGPPRAPPTALQVRAALTMEPLWRSADGHHELLKLKLSDTSLWTLGARPGADWRARPSIWPRASTSYAELRDGRLVTARAGPLPAPALRLHRALHALLQTSPTSPSSPGSLGNETDVHGECIVEYAWPEARTLHKTKRGCVDDPPWLQARRLARYSLDDAGVVERVHAEDVVGTPGGGDGLGVRARGWLRLERVSVRAPPALAPLSVLETTLAALPADVQRLTFWNSIDTVDEDETIEEEEPSLEEAVKPLLAVDDAGAGGGCDEAAALPAALAALRTASPAALRGLLDTAQPSALPAVARLLGLAGSSAAAAALRLDSAPPALRLHYYAALGASPRPEPAAAEAALRRGLKERRPAPLLGGAAAAARLGGPTARAARDELVRHAARADDPLWLETLVTALGNLRRADTVDALLERAERGDGRVSSAAVDALRAAPPEEMSRASRVRRLVRVVESLRAPLPLEARAAALELAMERGAEGEEGVEGRPLPPLELAWLAATLYEHGPPELLRLYWQLADRLPRLQVLLRGLPALARGWAARAAPGASLALRRPAGWAAGAWGSALRTLQAASGGLLRRGTVRLSLTGLGGSQPERPALALHLWTRGLEALAGGGGGGEGEEEEAGGGLALEVVGARLPGVSLFEGQAALLAAVWAGAGSEPAPVLRCALPLAEGAARPRLVTGEAVRLRWSAAAALALDAAAQASLWSRTARAGVELRVGLAGEGRAALAAGGARLKAEGRHRWRPRLAVDADLDFYGAPTLCVRVATEGGVEEREWRERRSGPDVGSGANVTSGRRGSGRRVSEGRGLWLDAATAKACRALAAS